MIKLSKFAGAAKIINFKAALIGALIMGSIVYYINADYGWNMAMVAALKQGIYTFFFGGIYSETIRKPVIKIQIHSQVINSRNFNSILDSYSGCLSSTQSQGHT